MGNNKFLQETSRLLEYKTRGAIKYSDLTKSKATFTLGAVPESEFMATAFGLPEPPGFEPPPTPLYVWLLTIAGVCLAFYVGFRFLARRRAAA